MIRIERASLPTGLRAIAQRDTDGILVIYVSEGLDAQRQRAAVMEAVRASRRAGWRGAVPAGVAAFGSVRLLLRRVAARIRTQPWSAAGWAGGSTAVIAGAVVGALVLSTAAGPHRPAKALGSRPGVSVSAAAPASGGRPGQPSRAGAGGRGSSRRGSGGAAPGGGTPAPSAGGTAAPTGGPPGGPTTGPPGGGGSSPPPSQTPPASGSTPPVAPTPAPSPSQAPKPSPTPSAAPPRSHSGPCIDLLVIGICL